ncbi:hypothetical protein SAMN04488066_104175 [Halorubrum aquaticum]|uniref:HTH cro/C1-type domain-containing protein n=1 Tax=Halorubrum aquaticum TaxID=387340 RepID=A0A1I3A5H6_9EURY|nr:hypothetical protein [Halorubrum aquaticum]SFH45392.1 hypothetical protein SAMN04488066_104175 [Halorubrum aquaticum]
MNTKQAFKKFIDFEAEFSVFSKSYNDVYYWDRIRCQVFSEIVEKVGIWSTDKSSFERQSVDRNLLLAGFSKAIHSLRSVRDSPLFTGRRDILFAAADTSRRQYFNETYWDVLVDPLADQIEYSYTSLEDKSKIKKMCDDNIWTHDTTATDQIHFISNISTILGDTVTVNADAADDIYFLERKIQDIFDVNIDLIARIQDELTQRKYTKPLYELLLRRIDPKVVIIRYNPSKSTLIEVCQEFGIPVIELQHGVDSEYSPEISYGDSINGEFCFPDVYFSWGDYWCNKPNFPIDDIRVVGWPFIETISEEYIFSNQQRKILFISQPTCGETLSQIAVEVADTIEQEVIYRLHPNERNVWRSLYPWLESSNVYIDSGERSLYDIMGECCTQVGTESTALYEGLMFNQNTYILDEFDSETHPWCEMDEITIFSEAETLCKYLKKTKNTNVDCSRFFRPNSIKNIQQEISDII